MVEVVIFGAAFVTKIVTALTHLEEIIVVAISQVEDWGCPQKIS